MKFKWEKLLKIDFEENLPVECRWNLKKFWEKFLTNLKKILEKLWRNWKVAFQKF